MDIYGVIGCPVKHSLSPAMHNAAFKACGIKAEYKTFEVRPEELEDFLLNKKEVVGFNITIPHKIRAKEILERKFPLNNSIINVKLSGAVNTVKRLGNKIEYCNTDVLGFLRSLVVDLKFDLKFGRENKNVLLIGCGGAGRAVIAGLSEFTSDFKIHAYDKSEKAVDSIREYFSKLSPALRKNLESKIEFIGDKDIPDKIKECQLLVNASPIGMREGDNSLIDKSLLHNQLSIYDLVYNRETELVKDARALHLPAAGGLGMLLYQGASSFEFWTGKRAPIDAMRKALTSAFSAF